MLTASKIMSGEFTVKACFWTVKLRLVKKQSIYYHHEKLENKKYRITLVILHVEVTRKLQSSVPVQETRSPLVAINAPDLKQRPTAATLKAFFQRSRVFDGRRAG